MSSLTAADALVKHGEYWTKESVKRHGYPNNITKTYDIQKALENAAGCCSEASVKVLLKALVDKNNPTALRAIEASKDKIVHLKYNSSREDYKFYREIEHLMEESIKMLQVNGIQRADSPNRDHFNVI